MSTDFENNTTDSNLRQAGPLSAKTTHMNREREIFAKLISMMRKLLIAVVLLALAGVPTAV